jgi:hypothetical protein
MKNEMELATALIKIGYDIASKELMTFRDSKEVVLMSVKSNGLTLQHASNSLKSDKEIVLAAVNQDGRALQYASDGAKNDKDIVLASVKQYGAALEFSSQDMRNDRDVVIKAVENTGYSLKFASDGLRNDKDIVLQAISDFAFAMSYAGEELRNDTNFIDDAITKNPDSIIYAGDEILDNKEFTMRVINRGGSILRFVSDKLKNDKDLVLAALKNNWKEVYYANDTLKNDRDVVLAAIMQSGKALSVLGDQVRNNKDLVLQAVKQNGIAIQYASREIKNDMEVALLAVKQNGYYIKYLDSAIADNPLIKESAPAFPFGLSSDRWVEFKSDVLDVLNIIQVFCREGMDLVQAKTVKGMAEIIDGMTPAISNNNKESVEDIKSEIQNTFGGAKIKVDLDIIKLYLMSAHVIKNINLTFREAGKGAAIEGKIMRIRSVVEIASMSQNGSTIERHDALPFIFAGMRCSALSFLCESLDDYWLYNHDTLSKSINCLAESYMYSSWLPITGGHKERTGDRCIKENGGLLATKIKLTKLIGKDFMSTLVTELPSFDINQCK